MDTANTVDIPSDESTIQHLHLALRVLGRNDGAEFDAIMDIVRGDGRATKATKKQIEMVDGLHFMIIRSHDPGIQQAWEAMLAARLDRKGWEQETWDWLVETNQNRLGLDTTRIVDHDSDDE